MPPIGPCDKEAMRDRERGSVVPPSRARPGLFQRPGACGGN